MDRVQRDAKPVAEPELRGFMEDPLGREARLEFSRDVCPDESLRRRPGVSRARVAPVGASPGVTRKPTVRPPVQEYRTLDGAGLGRQARKNEADKPETRD